jgi:hypothetical protein
METPEARTEEAPRILTYIPHIVQANNSQLARCGAAWAG